MSRSISSRNQTYFDELSPIRKVLDYVQKKTDSLDRLVNKLREIFNETEFEDFKKDFLSALTIILKTPRTNNAEHVYRLLDFYTTFLMQLHHDYQVTLNKSDSFDGSKIDHDLHPLLNAVFEFIFLNHNTNLMDARYHITILANKLMTSFGIDDEIPEDICEQIQEAFLQRLRDVKTCVRIEAIKVLYRLQNPFEENDPVSKALLQCLHDNNTKIRATVLKYIGLSHLNFSELLEHLRDENVECRLNLYKQIDNSIKVSMIRIENRIKILMTGLHDTNPDVLDFVKKSILMSWLDEYNKDMFRFFEALKLDATYDDLKNLQKLMEKIMEFFFKAFTAKELIELLNLDENTRTMDLKDLSIEKVIYWNILAKKLTEKDVYDENVNQILPELLDFTTYIETFAQEYGNKIKSDCLTDFLHFEFIFGQLISLLSFYSLEDVIQKNRAHGLLKKFLSEMSLSLETILIITKVYHRLIPKATDLIEEYFEIMYVIRYTKNIPKEISPEEIRKNELHKADLIFQMNMLKADLDQAVTMQNFIQAEKLKNDLNNVIAELELLQTSNVQEKDKELENDDSMLTDDNDDSIDDENEENETDDLMDIIRYIDMAIACLKVIRPKRANVAVDSKLVKFRARLCKDMDKFKVYNAILVKCLHCFGLSLYFSEEAAKKFLPFLVMPISTYSTPIIDKEYMKKTVAIITDLIMLYTTSIFETSYNTVATLHNRHDSATCNEPIMTIKQFTDILKDLLDHLDEEMRLIAVESLVRLLGLGCIQSGFLLGLLIVKWFNPASDQDNRIRQLISSLLTSLKNVTNGSILIKKAFPITVKMINDAPQNSPLSQIYIENVIKFLAELSCSKFFSHINTSIHREIILDLLTTIKKNIGGKCNVIFSKCLLYLELPIDDNEFVKAVEYIINEIKFDNQLEKQPNQNLQKNLDCFLNLLKTQSLTGEGDINGEKSDSNDEDN